MADVHSTAMRSYNMSRIRSKDSKPEMLVRKFLHGNGFRFPLHRKDLSGKPDIVLPKYKTMIFVHGCFIQAIVFAFPLSSLYNTLALCG
ncbi:hypothetical protein BH10BAC3_BH10BAC3_31520 [soil metagenome]